MAEVVITGVREIDRALRQLEPKVAKGAVRKGLRAGAKVMRSQVLAKVPVRSGDLKAAIKVKAGKRSRNKIRLNVIIGEGDFKGKTFYGAMVEFGHKVGPRALGDSRADFEGEHFMERSFDEAGPRAKTEAMRVIRDETLKAAAGGKV